MGKLQPKVHSVNNAVPLVNAHLPVKTFSSQALTAQDHILRLLSAFLSGRNERTIRAYGVSASISGPPT